MKKLGNIVMLAVVALMAATILTVSIPTQACDWCIQVKIGTAYKWGCRIQNNSGYPRWCTSDPSGDSCIDYGTCQGGAPPPPAESPTVAVNAPTNETMQVALAQEGMSGAVFHFAVAALKAKFAGNWPPSANVHLTLQKHTTEGGTEPILANVGMKISNDFVTLTYIQPDGTGKTLAIDRMTGDMRTGELK